jgi:hypothetical protein
LFPTIWKSYFVSGIDKECLYDEDEQMEKVGGKRKEVTGSRCIE